MKAFVIKNKAEDRYLHTFYVYEDELFAFGELNEAKLFDNLDNANYYKEIGYNGYNLKLEVVPITIVEGNLEEENRVLKRALELACEDVGIVNVITKVLTDDKATATVDDVAEYYIKQAKGE